MIKVVVAHNGIMKVKSMPHYILTDEDKLVNSQTMREMKKDHKGGKIGYWLKSKLYSIEEIKKMSEEI